MNENEAGNYKYCITCWRAEPQVEFLPESYDYQYRQRCKTCETVYQVEFRDKYPGTKLKHRMRRLTEKKLAEYIKMLEEERGFSDE